jgi:hypothetical protein
VGIDVYTWWGSWSLRSLLALILLSMSMKSIGPIRSITLCLGNYGLGYKTLSAIYFKICKLTGLTTCLFWFAMFDLSYGWGVVFPASLLSSPITCGSIRIYVPVGIAPLTFRTTYIHWGLWCLPVFTIRFFMWLTGTHKLYPTCGCHYWTYLSHLPDPCRHYLPVDADCLASVKKFENSIPNSFSETW